MGTVKQIADIAITSFFTGQMNYRKIKSLSDTILQLTNNATNMNAIQQIAYEKIALALIGLDQLASYYSNIQNAYLLSVNYFLNHTSIWHNYTLQKNLTTYFYDNITKIMFKVNGSNAVSTSDPVYLSVYNDFVNCTDLYNQVLATVQIIEQSKDLISSYLKGTNDYLIRSYTYIKRSNTLCKIASDFYDKKVTSQQHSLLIKSIDSTVSFIENEFNSSYSKLEEELDNYQIISQLDSEIRAAQKEKNLLISHLNSIPDKIQHITQKAAEELAALQSSAQKAAETAQKTFDDARLAAFEAIGRLDSEIKAVQQETQLKESELNSVRENTKRLAIDQQNILTNIENEIFHRINNPPNDDTSDNSGDHSDYSDSIFEWWY
jgi:hypothetical protein